MLRLREPGKCYFCGEPLNQHSQCGGYHSIMEQNRYEETCCECVGCKKEVKYEPVGEARPKETKAPKRSRRKR